MNQFLGKRLSWPIQIVVWIFALYIAVSIIDNGYAKLTQDPGTIQFFESIGVPFSAMMAAGIVEVVGSILLFVPWISFYAAVAVAVVMATATYFNVGSDWVTINSLVLAIIIAIFSRPGFLRKKPIITKITI